MRSLANAKAWWTMIHFTSDLHLGHKNIIRLCNRPFSSSEEMDEVLMENWNRKVHRNDTIYILGDLMFRSEKPPEDYLRQLKGKKHLIMGNHCGVLAADCPVR